MNAKTEDTLISLKMLSAMEREMHERATKVNPMPFGCGNPLTNMFNQLLKEARA